MDVVSACTSCTLLLSQKLMSLGSTIKGIRPWTLAQASSACVVSVTNWFKPPCSNPDLNHSPAIKKLSPSGWSNKYFCFFASPSSRHSYQPVQGIKQRCVANACANVFLWAAVSDWALMINFFDQLGLMPHVMVDCAGCLFFWLMVVTCMDGLISTLSSSRLFCGSPGKPKPFSSLVMLGILRTWMHPHIISLQLQKEYCISSVYCNN